MPLLELEEALAKILATIPPPRTERVPLIESPGRVLAGAIQSPIDLPAFDNSAMDGYAVRAIDVGSARPEAPWRLRLIGKAAAGERFRGEITAGTCVRLFTGSPLPRGADAVVMQEDTRAGINAADEILVLAPVAPAENVRRRGEDVEMGATLATAGELLTVGRAGLLAAAGLTGVIAGRQPVVGVLATGSELKDAGQPLEPGQIYESNRITLAALTRGAGAIPKVLPVVTDSLAATRLALSEAFDQCDAVVTSGGVSVGDLDFIRGAFEQIGGEVCFWKVAIRPGRPFVFGRYREKLLFGLPGNPVSAFVTFLLLVRPALLRWQGAVDLSMPMRPGVLTAPMTNPDGRRHFMRVRIHASGKVDSAGMQGSHILSSLAASNGLLDLPPGAALAAGAPVEVMCWE